MIGVLCCGVTCFYLFLSSIVKRFGFPKALHKFPIMIVVVVVVIIIIIIIIICVLRMLWNSLPSDEVY